MKVGKKVGSRCLWVFMLTLSAFVLAPLFYLNSVYGFDVTLAWDPNTERDLAGYKIYYGTAPGGPYNGSGSKEGASPILVPVSRLANGVSPEFTVSGLPYGTYYFVATAYNSAGFESSYSNETRAQGSNSLALQPPNSAVVLAGLEVNGQGGSTSVYTNNRNVAVRIVASDNALVSQYLILDGRSDPSGGVFHTIPGGPRRNAIFTINDFLLNDNDGNHTIYAWVKDDQGLTSSTATKTNVILERMQTVAGLPVGSNYTPPISSGITDATIRLGADLVADFGASHGLWRNDRVRGWMKLSTVSPAKMLAVDLDKDGTEELVASFTGYGLYVYKEAKGWSQLNTIIPDVMMRWGNGIACDYATYGLWYWTQAGGWKQLNTVDPVMMTAVDIDNDSQDELAVTFSGYGLWIYDQSSGWSQLNTIVPDAMIRWGNGIACDYAAYGLWYWTQAGGWKQLNTGDPVMMVAVDLDNDRQKKLVVNFSGFGFYSYDPIAGWASLSSLSPDAMASVNRFN